jgi:hypothetical protein
LRKYKAKRIKGSANMTQRARTGKITPDAIATTEKMAKKPTAKSQNKEPGPTMIACVPKRDRTAIKIRQRSM